MNGADYIAIGAGAGLGAAVGYLKTRGAGPSMTELVRTAHTLEFWILLVAYFIIGYALLWLVMHPETTEEKVHWLITGAWWNVT